MEKKLQRHIAAVLIMLVPCAYLLVKWEMIPDIVPVHFNGRFEPDRYDSKSTLWIMTAILSGTTMLTYALLENLHRIDPKRKGKELPNVFHKLSFGIALFMTGLGLLVIVSCIGQGRTAERLLIPLMGFFFAFLGNLMYNIKPNYFAGVRVPWTLRSDDNWKKTHQFAGKLWVVVGILMALTGLLTHDIPLEYIVLPAVLIFAGVPIAYSYAIYKEERKNKLL